MRYAFRMNTRTPPDGFGRRSVRGFGRGFSRGFSRRMGAALAAAMLIAFSAYALGSCARKTEGPSSAAPLDVAPKARFERATGSAPNEMFASGDTPIGKLRKLDEFPLYELEYSISYDPERYLVAPKTGALPRAEPDFACSCFAALDARGNRAFGRNFDWDRHPILVLLAAPEGAYASISLVDLHYLGYGPGKSPLDDPAALADAPRLPFDGMNEKGLAVGMMAVPSADGGADPAKPTVGELGLIRLALDRAATVDEAIAVMGSYNVDFSDVPLHYMVADASGASAVVEYPAGKPVVLRGTATWQAATNFVMSETPEPNWTSMCRRYRVASETLGGSKGALGPGGTLGLLSDLSQNSTIWSSAYGLSTRELTLCVDRKWDTAYQWKITR